MTKIIINNNEIDLLENPINIFLKLYGLNNHLLRLILLKFECFNNEIFVENKIEILFVFLQQFLTSTYNTSLLTLYNILLIDCSNTYHTFRHIFNLPVNGQRTWGGGKSIKITKSQLFNHKLKKYAQIAKLPYTLFLSETVNILWKYQWYHEWLYSSKYLKRLPWYVKKKKKYVGLNLLLNKRIESFFKHPYKGKKKKHHRKKKIIDRHTVSTGFPIGFSWEFKKNLKL